MVVVVVAAVTWKGRDSTMRATEGGVVSEEPPEANSVASFIDIVGSEKRKCVSRHVGAAGAGGTYGVGREAVRRGGHRALRLDALIAFSSRSVVRFYPTLWLFVMVESVLRRRRSVCATHDAPRPWSSARRVLCSGTSEICAALLNGRPI